MDLSQLDQLLADYRQLVTRVNRHAAAVETSCRDQMACRPGCASCCRQISVSAIEALVLWRALQDLPSGVAAAHREAATAAVAAEVCPLLEGGLCRLYAARPLICRTHGLPLLVEDDGGRRVDFCPLSFTAGGSLPGALVLDLERLNTLLALLNRQFLGVLAAQGIDLPPRLSLGAALSLQL